MTFSKEDANMQSSMTMNRLSVGGERSPAGSGRRKAAAILEVLGIYAAGQLAAYLIGLLLGLQLQNPLSNLAATISPADLTQITLQLLTLLLLQYAGWFLLILPIGWWYRRRKPAQYGLTLGDRSLGAHVITGAVLFAFAGLPMVLLASTNTLVPLGEQTPWREALFSMDWSTPAFWLFMAVGSFGLVPVLEELFYRGYCQARLEEDLGAPAAILTVSLLFTFSHSQYYILNVLNAGTLLATVFGSLAWGYIFYRTRSLAPTIVAHALENLPVRGISLWVELAAMIVVCIVARREIARYVKDFITLLRGMSPLWQGILFAALGALFAAALALLGDVVVLVGLGIFVIALVLEAIDRHTQKLAA
jgi:membrane protease YdiL (CAAX protease family)